MAETRVEAEDIPPPPPHAAAAAHRKRKHVKPVEADTPTVHQLRQRAVGEEVPVDVAVLVLEHLRSMVQASGQRETCFGRPVDVLTPRDLSALAETAASMREAGSSFLGVAVAPKYDGERMLMVGVRHGAAALSVYFVTPCGRRVFAAGRVLCAATAAAAKIPLRTFVLDGEFRQSSQSPAAATPTFAIHDVLSYRGRSTNDIAFLDRLKFAVPVLRMLASSTILRCGHRSSVAVVLKPVFDVGATLHVLAQCAEGKFGETDGLVLTDALRARAASKKYKPDATVDFLLVDGHRLCVQGDGAGQLMFVCKVDSRDLTPALALGGPRVLECRFERGVDDGGGADGDDADGDDADGALFRMSSMCGGKWRVVKQRPDKPAPNHVSVFERNCQLILHALTPDDIAAATSATPAAPPAAPPAATPAAAPYYAALDAGGAVPRSQQATARMRGFHSSVKAALYADMLSGARTMLELGCGRGADVVRVVRFGRSLERLVVADADARCLAEYERRWRLMAAPTQSGGPELSIAPRGDCNDTAYARGLQAQYPRHFDCVSAQFCLHYFHAAAPALVSAVLAEGGCFACTLFDGEQVLAALRDTTDARLAWCDPASGAVRACIELVDARGLRLPSARDARAAAGAHVAVFVDSIGRRIVEPLVDIDDLVQRMKAVGLECTRRESFAAFPSDFFLASTEPLFQFSALNCALMFEKVTTTTTAATTTAAMTPPPPY